MVHPHSYVARGLLRVLQLATVHDSTHRIIIRGAYWASLRENSFIIRVSLFGGGRKCKIVFSTLS